MKIQLQEHSVRLRIDEDELALLLAGTAVAASTPFAQAFVFAGSVTLADAGGVSISGSSDAYRIAVPAAEVRALAARLPTRDGLLFELPGGGELRFDVDVRDSVRRRQP
jgi:hypothetical protein